MNSLPEPNALVVVLTPTRRPPGMSFDASPATRGAHVLPTDVLIAACRQPASTGSGSTTATDASRPCAWCALDVHGATDVVLTGYAKVHKACRELILLTRSNPGFSYGCLVPYGSYQRRVAGYTRQSGRDITARMSPPATTATSGSGAALLAGLGALASLSVTSSAQLELEVDAGGVIKGVRVVDGSREVLAMNGAWAGTNRGTATRQKGLLVDHRHPNE